MEKTVLVNVIHIPPKCEILGLLLVILILEAAYKTATAST
jgi:hypothetical protein